jgi:exodeoxyribonuclease V alpha subunit
VLGDQVLRAGARLLGAPVEQLNVTMEEMVVKGELIQRPVVKGQKGQAQVQQALFLPFYDRCEAATAERIRRMAAEGGEVVEGGEDLQARAIEKVQKRCGVEFDDVQLAAIVAATRSRFMVVTGGPGTGKTTTALGIIGLLREQGVEVALAAPTGRAAQRLASTTEMEAKTIHRLLEYSSETRSFKRGPGNLLTCDVLVVDEVRLVAFLASRMRLSSRVRLYGH